ncbi:MULTISPECIES: Bax inhibitor-1/YccA family protein [unclassified Pseudoclavibacter]|uniref:Bax inhibitor-1/YccA family protein n=1 Tax=unclassified Pseudoclavibacter TaxID=2615177 RepID=UPI001BAD24C8|nr:Bax inhibitor-1/YccA family protein [Pseudoclavibacter sp. Marseille-Q4354]MBS3177161.1 Bax inhibitor-1/YccA family protein [Pseudoclavibacter sp. Marseille-Q4354]
MANSALERNPYFNGEARRQHGQQFGQAPTAPSYGNAPSASTYGQQPPAPLTADQLNAQFQAPPATPDQMERMSYEDTIAKTAGLFGIVLVAAAVAWFVPMLMIVGAIGALVLSLVLAFQREPKTGLIFAFAAAEGLLVGGLSSILEGMFPGIAMQAVLATFSVVAVTLVLFRFGKVRTSPRMTKIVLVAMLGYALFSLINFGMMMFGFESAAGPWGMRSMEVFGIPLGVILGIFAVLMGAYMLVMDFELIKNGVEGGAPRKYGWIGAYSLVSTVVFIYVEIIRVLAILRGNN